MAAILADKRFLENSPEAEQSSEILALARTGSNRELFTKALRRRFSYRGLLYNRAVAGARGDD